MQLRGVFIDSGEADLVLDAPPLTASDYVGTDHPDFRFSYDAGLRMGNQQGEAQCNENLLTTLSINRVTPFNHNRTRHHHQHHPPTTPNCTRIEWNSPTSPRQTACSHIIKSNQAKQAPALELYHHPRVQPRFNNT